VASQRESSPSGGIVRPASDNSRTMNYVLIDPQAASVIRDTNAKLKIVLCD
jgi:hypothetical protein